MRIATCGGETGWRCLILAHLAAEWMSRGHQALLIDATPEQELITHLELAPALLSRLPRLGEEGFRIKEYVAGQGAMRASAITECTQPTSRSRQVACTAEDPFLRCFSTEVPYPSHHADLAESTARLISLGSCDEADITSLRRHHQALSILLNHLADGPHDGVFIHLNAGQLPCITGVLGRIDLAVLVEEAAPQKSSAGEVEASSDLARSIRQTLERLRTPTVAISAPTHLDSELPWHNGGAQPSSIAGNSLLTEAATLRIPRENPQQGTVSDAVGAIIDFTESLQRDPARFARNNELMARIAESATEESSAAM